MPKSNLIPLLARRRLLAGLALSSLLSLGGTLQAASLPFEDLDTPYVQTPDTVVNAMLDLVDIRPDDVVIDLGAGDGRLLIEAARRGASGFGVDIDPMLVRLANDNARKAGVADRARFVEQDLYETDLSSATVLTIYLLPAVNRKLMPTLLALRPGTRIVSHDYGFGDWPPDRKITVEAPNKPVNALKTSDLLYYVVPARVQGGWTGRSAQGPWHMVLEQSYQYVTGKLVWNEQEWQLPSTALEGDALKLTAGADDDAISLALRFERNEARGELSYRGQTQEVTLRRTP